MYVCVGVGECDVERNCARRTLKFEHARRDFNLTFNYPPPLIILISKINVCPNRLLIAIHYFDCIPWTDHSSESEYFFLAFLKRFAFFFS